MWAVITQEVAMPPNTVYIPYERLGIWVAMVPKWPFKFGFLAGDSITPSKLLYVLEVFVVDNIENVLVRPELLSVSVKNMRFKYCIGDIIQVPLTYKIFIQACWR